MAEVELAQDALIVHVEGMDRLFALRSRLEVPLSHVEGAEADPQEARRRWHGIMEREYGAFLLSREPDLEVVAQALSGPSPSDARHFPWRWRFST